MGGVGVWQAELGGVVGWRGGCCEVGEGGVAGGCHWVGVGFFVAVTAIVGVIRGGGRGTGVAVAEAEDCEGG